MKKDTVVELRRPAQAEDLLSTMLREGAQRLVAQSVQAEFNEFLARFSGERMQDGRAPVVRNGFQPERDVLTGLGPVAVRVPKARSRGEAPAVFHSRLVPPYVRRARSVDAVLPWLYLHGVSTGDMREALAALVGPQAAGLSASVVARLKGRWMEEYRLWRRSKLGKDRLGLSVGRRDLLGASRRERAPVRFGGHRRERARPEEVPRDRGRSARIQAELARGAVGDETPRRGDSAAPGGGRRGARVLGGARRDLPADAPAEVLGAQDCERAQLPAEIGAAQGEGRPAEIWMAETRAQAVAAFEQFLAAFGAKYPKAVECLAKDREALLAFYDFPAEHWIHIRTSNAIESTFATVRHRTERTKGCLTRDGMLAIFKLGTSAERRWRRLRGFQWLPQGGGGGQIRGGVGKPDKNR